MDRELTIAAAYIGPAIYLSSSCLALCALKASSQLLKTLKAVSNRTAKGVWGPCSRFWRFCLISGEAWLIK